MPSDFARSLREGTHGFSGDAGPATNAMLNSPYGVSVDVFGNLFLAEISNSRIRKVSTNGVITTIAGNGTNGYSGDGVPATNTSLCTPIDTILDASGNLFIADENNYRIRKVSTNGIIMTVAGNGTNVFSGDGGPATKAGLSHPIGIALDSCGNLFISDNAANRVRKVDTNGFITTVAGNGSPGYSGDGGAASKASLNSPTSVAVDAFGNLFFTELGNFRIRKVDTNGIITTVAGNGTSGYSGDGGPATNANLSPLLGLYMDAFGNLFISDSFNNRVRKVNVNGIITTVAGNGSPSYSGDGGAAANAGLNAPRGVVVDSSGNLFIADSGNSRIRMVSRFASYPTLTLNNATTNDGGNYSVTITGPNGSVTSSMVALNVASSPFILKSMLNPDGSVTLNLLTAPNTGSRVLAATNLTPPVLWQPIFTNVAGPAGAWQFTDTNAASQTVRFYRSSTP